MQKAKCLSEETLIIAEKKKKKKERKRGGRKRLGWMKQKLESSLQGEMSITTDMWMAPSYGRK